MCRRWESPNDLPAHPRSYAYGVADLQRAEAVTQAQPGKLNAGCLELPSNCEICRKHRSAGSHKKCSRIRQERHAQALGNEEFDRLLMFDKKESDDDPPIPIQRTHADAHQRPMVRFEGGE